MERSRTPLAYTGLSVIEKRLALGISVLLLASSLAVAPFAHSRPFEIHGFLPMVCGIVLVCDVLSTIVLYEWFSLTRDEPTAVLALAYGISTIFTLVYLLTFPGVITSAGLFGAGLQTAPWVSAIGRVHFLVLLIVFANWRAKRTPSTGARRKQLRLLLFAVVASALGALIVVRFGYAGLPAALHGSALTPQWRLGVAPLVLALNAGTLAVIVVKTRLKSSVDVWLAVACLGFFCDFFVASELADGRFTVGWYYSSVQWLFASVSFMGALLSNISRILAKLTSRNASLFDESITDDLTGLLNKRGFNDRLERAFRVAASTASPLALLLLDVDHFKTYNDTFGHVAGDVALSKVAQVVRQYAQRAEDAAARIGGEELAVILPDTGENGAYALAERIRSSVENLSLQQGPGSSQPVLTISVGVISTENRDVPDTVALRTRCDAALYEAKRLGRNRVALASGERARVASRLSIVR